MQPSAATQHCCCLLTLIHAAALRSQAAGAFMSAEAFRGLCAGAPPPGAKNATDASQGAAGCQGKDVRMEDQE